MPTQIGRIVEKMGRMSKESNKYSGPLEHGVVFTEDEDSILPFITEFYNARKHVSNNLVLLTPFQLSGEIMDELHAPFYVSDTHASASNFSENPCESHDWYVDQSEGCETDKGEKCLFRDYFGKEKTSRF